MTIAEYVGCENCEKKTVCKYANGFVNEKVCFDNYDILNISIICNEQAPKIFPIEFAEDRNGDKVIVMSNGESITIDANAVELATKRGRK